MTAAEIYLLARGAGFAPEAAVKMTAIALRESGGNPAAFNDDAKTGDKSYGLWQINMFRSLAPERIRLFSLASEQDLFTPEVNARAAYILSNGGSEAALRQHWYIDRWNSPYGYAEKYTANLAIALAAAEQVEGAPPGGESAPWVPFQVAAGRDWIWAAAGLGGALALWVLFGD